MVDSGTAVAALVSAANQDAFLAARLLVRGPASPRLAVLGPSCRHPGSTSRPHPDAERTHLLHDVLLSIARRLIVACCARRFADANARQPRPTCPSRSVPLPDPSEPPNQTAFEPGFVRVRLEAASGSPALSHPPPPREVYVRVNCEGRTRAKGAPGRCGSGRMDRGKTAVFTVHG